MGELIRVEFDKKPKKVERCTICGDELVGDTCIRCDPPDFVESVQEELINAEGQKVQFIPTLDICPDCKNPYQGDRCPVCSEDVVG